MPVTFPPPSIKPAASLLANFHAFFQHIAGKDQKAQATEVENYILGEILGRNTADPGVDRKIRPDDFGKIRRQAGLPFAWWKLGYWSKNRYMYVVSDEQCGKTFVSGDADVGSVVKTMFNEIQFYSKEDVFANGAAEQAFQDYYFARQAPEKPIKTTYGSWPFYETWSQPYDVGASPKLVPCVQHMPVK